MVRPIEELPFPEQCQTNPRGLNAVVVYDDRSYPIDLSHFASQGLQVWNHQPREWSSNNLIGMGGGWGRTRVIRFTLDGPWVMTVLFMGLLLIGSIIILYIYLI